MRCSDTSGLLPPHLRGTEHLSGAFGGTSRPRACRCQRRHCWRRVHSPIRSLQWSTSRRSPRSGPARRASGRAARATVAASMASLLPRLLALRRVCAISFGGTRTQRSPAAMRAGSRRPEMWRQSSRAKRRSGVRRRAQRRAARGRAVDAWNSAHGVATSASLTRRLAVAFWLRQKIVGCAIDDRAESAEVGVHRDLRADSVFGTVDFRLSASSLLNTVGSRRISHVGLLTGGVHFALVMWG